MYIIILGIIFAIAGFYIGYQRAFFNEILEGILHAAAGILIFCAGLFIIAPESSDYTNDSLQYKIVNEETYEIMENNGQYYDSRFSSALDNYHVTVKIKDKEGLFEEKNYKTDSLKINTTADVASITIKYAEVKAFNYIVDRPAKWWKDNFFLDLSVQNKIVEIIVSIPENEIDTPSGDSMQTEVAPLTAFCQSCGNQVELDWQYCTKCGAKVEE